MNYVSAELKSYLPDTAGPLWEFILEYPLLLIVLFAAIGYATGKLLQVKIRYVLKKFSENTRFDLNDRLVYFLTAPVVQTTVILALIAAEKVFNLSDSLDRFLVRVDCNGP